MGLVVGAPLDPEAEAERVGAMVVGVGTGDDYHEPLFPHLSSLEGSQYVGELVEPARKRYRSPTSRP
ncbi:uncharacterized protein A4U43_C07F18900 [Asparagus officinalis]|uniref:Uncharacterized protein n=1 Tax=Asparagus officinalis TaxID=4686 RepID=A0A5P1ED23_ASPOF|nr:uncharacterized protein A4U43_C07F18900 [Asparagus officinalis]